MCAVLLLYVVMSVTLIIPPDCLVNGFIAHVITKGIKVRLSVLCLTERGSVRTQVLIAALLLP